MDRSPELIDQIASVLREVTNNASLEGHAGAGDATLLSEVMYRKQAEGGAVSAEDLEELKSICIEAGKAMGRVEVLQRVLEVLKDWQSK